MQTTRNHSMRVSSVQGLVPAWQYIDSRLRQSRVLSCEKSALRFEGCTRLPARAQAATALPVLEERRREVTTQLGQQLGRLGHGFVASTHDLFEQACPARFR